MDITTMSILLAALLGAIVTFLLFLLTLVPLALITKMIG